MRSSVKFYVSYSCKVIPFSIDPNLMAVLFTAVPTGAWKYLNLNALHKDKFYTR